VSSALSNSIAISRYPTPHTRSWIALSRYLTPSNSIAISLSAELHIRLHRYLSLSNSIPQHLHAISRATPYHSNILQVSFAKEPYKRDDILEKRPVLLRSLLIVATPYHMQLYTIPMSYQCVPIITSKFQNMCVFVHACVNRLPLIFTPPPLPSPFRKR